jgi:hypothetical protein
MALMKKIVLNVLLFGVLALVGGYLSFGKMGGRYVEITRLLFPPENVFESLGNALTGLAEVRRNILLSGLAGALFGLVVAVAPIRRSGRRRRR